MKIRFKKWWFKVWLKYNPEGIRGKDSFFVFWFIVGVSLILINLFFWLGKEEQKWIGECLFPTLK